MRSDIKKCVTERPRSGARLKSPKGYKKECSRVPEEDQSKREKIRRKWVLRYSGKEFTDVLGPLYGYLLKQVGRPWNKVYSEISVNLPKTSTQNIHIYGHIWDFVERNVIIVDGVACYKNCRFYGVPITSTGRHEQLYINPVTGLLCKAKRGKDKYSLKNKIEAPVPGVKVYPGIQYHKLKGFWYEVKVEPFNGFFGGFYFYVKDLVLGYSYYKLGDLIKVYGGLLLAYEKRQLTKKEIRAANLEPLSSPNKVRR